MTRIKNSVQRNPYYCMKALNITLDKEQYLVGETVKGTLNIPANKDIRLPNFKFAVYGAEKTKITLGREVFSSSNVFFDQDLSSFLTYKQGLVYQGGTLEISKGLKQIPFEFIIPKYSLPSYKGKYTHIDYIICAKQDKQRILPHVNEKLSFKVANFENGKIISDNKVVIDTGNKDISLKMELERNSFYAGEKVKGKLIVINPVKKKIKSAQIILKGSEYAVGQEGSEIEIDTGFGISFSYNRKNKKGEKKKEMTTKTQEYKIGIEWNKVDSMPFELSLPTEIKKSYTGKFSKYFWILEAKLDIAWSKDLHVETGIEII
jgi:hypothetical protein